MVHIYKKCQEEAKLVQGIPILKEKKTRGDLSYKQKLISLVLIDFGAILLMYNTCNWTYN